ncbi:MAG: hypothetical protein WC238_00960 [Parcubacteria group bacterium]|jgi:Tol biopolymer transport system component
MAVGISPIWVYNGDMRKIKTWVAVVIILVATGALAALLLFYNKEQKKLLESSAQLQGQKQTTAPRVKKPKDAQFLFATFGDRNVYKIQRGDKWLVVLDGQESPLYDCVGNPAFSPDGSQFAYSACLDGKTFVVIDGVPLTSGYDSISEIAFSPDGKKLAYVAGREGKYVVVLNQMEGKAYQEIGLLQTEGKSAMLIFSPDSQQIFYKVIENNQQFMVINNQEGKHYSDIGTLYFNSDGSQFAYDAQDGNRQVTVVNNVEVAVTNTNNTNNSSTNPNNYAPTTNNSSGNSYRRSGRDVFLDPNRMQVPICEGGDKCNF